MLAAECQRFRDEQQAILRARQVSRQADTVLGMVGRPYQELALPGSSQQTTPAPTSGNSRLSRTPTVRWVRMSAATHDRLCLNGVA